ncbi:Uracil-DNA glycosylase, family 4 [hydrothermal vent metagenome]|uniref:Type-4 uracil-DNA glycosylase n=1 Tax=hydrothermal vent metagenome TaxID=652676 RepID=A0A3B1ATY1_9ZZZZ
MSDVAQRRAYLQAMGIQAWVRRDEDSSRAASKTAQDAVLLATDGETPKSDEEVMVRGVKPQASAARETATPEACADGQPVSVEPPAQDVRAKPPVTPRGEIPVTTSSGTDISGLDWDALQAAVARCTACGLYATRTQTVFGAGNRMADWMIVGEAPGADEDRQGEPFVGRAGQLLNNMLRAIGLPREQVYIANVIKCRPPNNRNPHVDEVSQCLGYLQRQIARVKPRLILVVGRVAAHGLLKVDTPLGRLRGQVYRFCDTPVVVTYHPAYLLRTPRDKAKSWDDLRFARRLVEGHDGGSGQT